MRREPNSNSHDDGSSSDRSKFDPHDVVRREGDSIRVFRQAALVGEVERRVKGGKLDLMIGGRGVQG